jgi:hypothetical protein
LVNVKCERARVRRLPGEAASLRVHNQGPEQLTGPGAETILAVRLDAHGEPHARRARVHGGPAIFET